MWATPLHLEGAEEEIFYVLAGSGVSVQWEGEDTLGYDVGAGDCLVHLALENAHTLQGGRRRDRRAGVRSAHVCGCDLASARGSGVARRDLGSGRRRGGSPVGTRGCGRPARDRRDVAEAGEHRQRRGRRAGRARRRHRRPTRSEPRPGGRIAADRAPPRGDPSGQAERASALPLGRGGDLRRARGRQAICSSGRRTESSSIRSARDPSSRDRPARAWPTRSEGAPRAWRC